MLVVSYLKKSLYKYSLPSALHRATVLPCTGWVVVCVVGLSVALVAACGCSR